jgi:hypothetical protein
MQSEIDKLTDENMKLEKALQDAKKENQELNTIIIKEKENA